VNSGNIGCGLLLGCICTVASYRLFAPRFRESWRWRGTSVAMSFRTRVTACIWMFGWTLVALFGFGSGVIIIPVVASIFLLLCKDFDMKKHEDGHEDDT
jgi:hypothetical protein